MRPAACARSPNAIDGALTGLSPDFTHGVLALPEGLSFLNQRDTVDRRWRARLVAARVSPGTAIDRSHGAQAA